MLQIDVHYNILTTSCYSCSLNHVRKLKQKCHLQGLLSLQKPQNIYFGVNRILKGNGPVFFILNYHPSAPNCHECLWLRMDWDEMGYGANKLKCAITSHE